MRPFQRLLRKWQQRRKDKRLALIGEVASLVIQQHGESWQPMTICGNCQQPVSDLDNFCKMCGTSFLIEDMPTPVPPPPPDFDEKHTSGIHRIILPPKWPLPPSERVTCLIRTQRIPAIDHDLAVRLQKKGATK